MKHKKVFLLVGLLAFLTLGCIKLNITRGHTGGEPNPYADEPTSTPARSTPTRQATSPPSSGSAVSILDVQMSTALDQDAYPINPKSSFVFSPHDQVCFSGEMRGTVQPGLTIRFDFYYIEREKMIGSQSFVAQGSEKRVWMILLPPDSGWPKGNYKCKMYVDGEYLRDLHWMVN